MDRRTVTAMSMMATGAGPAAPGRRPPPHRRLLVRFRRSWPPLPQLLLGALMWALSMTVSALFSLYLRNRLQTFHLQELAILYFCGGLLAWLAMLPLGRLLACGHAAPARFAAFFLVLTLGTIATTAFLFALEYRQFYAQWHEVFGTGAWLLQFIFTCANAAYQFAVLGIRLYLPLGLIFLIAASLFLTRRMR